MGLRRDAGVVGSRESAQKTILYVKLSLLRYVHMWMWEGTGMLAF